MKHLIIIMALGFCLVGFAALFGFSEEAGLFGAILGCSGYAAICKS